jgi:hypothetical protein
MKDNLQKKLEFQIPELGERESQFLSTTGFFPNFFGKYRSCGATADMNYILTKWTIYTGPGHDYTVGGSGICAPSECSSTDIVQFFTNSTFPHILPLNMTGSEMKANLKVYEQQVKPGWGFWTFFAGFGFFTVVAIAFTLINCVDKQKKSAKKLGFRIITEAMPQSLNETDLPGSGIKNSAMTNGPQSLQLGPGSGIANDLKKPFLPEIEAQKNSMQTKPEVKKDSFFMTQIVAPFDVINRWKSITVSKRPGALSGAFDLVRLLSMGWVVMAHQFSMRSGMSDSSIDINGTALMEQGSWNVTFIEHGFYAVDFFLFMGGYVAIISLKRLTSDFKNSPKWKLPVLYIFIVIKRYARILPMVAVITMFVVYVLPYITYRWPNNKQIQSGQETPMYWGSWSLAYAWNIFGGPENINAGWFWYLVVDFQCFLIVPILLMLLPIDKRLPIALSVGLVIASCTYGMWTGINFPIYGNKIDPNFSLKYYFNVL